MSELENNKKLNAFFSSEYDKLKSYVHTKISNTSERDAEDILQDVALKIFSRSGDISPINNVAGFVYNSIRNKIVDILRSKKNEKELHNENEQKLIDFIDLFYGNSDNSYSDEMKIQLVTCISNLKPHYKHIIIAIDFEGYTYRELSTITDIPEGTLLSRRHRALTILNKQLKNNSTLIN